MEDDADFAEPSATRLELEAVAIDVETATGAEAALERLRAEPFDCVVSDYDMPRTDASGSSRPSARSTPTSRSSCSPARAPRRWPA